MRMKPKTKDVFATVGNFLSSFVTAAVAILAIFLVIVKLLGWNLFSVESPSMSPQYPQNTLVIVQPVAPEEIEVGDVVTYVLNADGVFVTHRVVEINTADRTFITKGDANSSADPSPVLWDNVVGKVLFDIPAVGRPMQFLTAQENRPIVITVIVVLFVISLVWDLVARHSQKKRKKEETTVQEQAEKP